jgi:hypothetical protein
MDFATVMRGLMCEQGVTGRALARQVPCDQGLVSRLVNGQQRPSERIASRIDDALGASGQLVDAARSDLAAARRVATWRSMQDCTDNDDVNRRDMLAVMMGGPFALELERIRRNLDAVSQSSASERDAEEWERAAAAYAHQVVCSPHAHYLPHLLADACEITDRVVAASGSVRARLMRSAAQIAALAAMGLGALGEPMTAARWWRTAARVAGEAGDAELTALILGRQAVLALYEPGGDSVALTLAGYALAAVGGRVCAGTAGAHAARAQAYSQLGRHVDALAALADLERTWGRLPAADINAADSEWGWPERRVLKTRSWVLSKVGDVDAALAAQEAVLALYPYARAGSAQVEMHRVETLIRSGDVNSGATHCVTVLTALSAGWRQNARVLSAARGALAAVPPALTGRQSVREAREVLALPAPGSS